MKKIYVYSLFISSIIIAIFYKVLFIGHVGEEYNLLYAFQNADYNLLLRYFTQPVAGLHTAYFTYRPLWYFYWVTIYKIFGLYPLPYHLTTIVFHIFNSLLIYFVVRKILDEDLGFFTALIYGIHPIAICTAAWWNSSADLFFQFFIMLGLLFHIYKIDTFQKKIYISIIYIFALLSKENGILLMPVIFLYDYLLNNNIIINENIIKRFIKTIKINLYLIIIFVFYILFRLFIFRSFQSYVNAPEITPSLIIIVLFRRLRIAIFYDMILTNLSLFPYQVSLIYIFVLFFSLLIFTYTYIRKKLNFNLVLFCILGYIASSLPVINISQSIKSYKLIMNTRYIYFPLFFCCILIVFFMFKIFNKRWAIIVLSFYILFLCYKTYTRTELFVYAADINQKRWDLLSKYVPLYIDKSHDEIINMVRKDEGEIEHKSIHSMEIDIVYPQQIKLIKLRMGIEY